MPLNCSWIEWTSDQAADLAADSDLISFFHRYFLCPKWAQICVISWAQARYVCIKGNRQSIPHLLIQLFYSLFASMWDCCNVGWVKPIKYGCNLGWEKSIKYGCNLGFWTDLGFKTHGQHHFAEYAMHVKRHNKNYIIKFFLKFL